MAFATSLLILTLTVLVVGLVLLIAFIWILRQDTKRLEKRAEELAAFEADTQPHR
jgi:hypothetical protein